MRRKVIGRRLLMPDLAVPESFQYSVGAFWTFLFLTLKVRFFCSDDQAAR
jgi:hypothetical protein